MKQYSKLFSLVALLGATSGMLADDNNNSANRVVPFIQWRSQGRNMANKLIGETPYAIYQGDMDGTYGTFDVLVQYDQSFRKNQITQALFGPAVVENATGTTTTTTTTTNNCNKSCNDDAIVISGLNSVTSPATRGPRELMAENFLLPRDFKSTITFAPKVQNVIVNFDLFVGLDRWVNGLYFRLYGPVAWNRVTLKPEENVINKGTATTFNADGSVNILGGGYQQGFFDPNQPVPTQSLYPQALNFFGGCSPFPVQKYGTLKDVIVQPLQFAKFSDCPTISTNSCDDDCNSFRHHKTGFAELRGEFGYNYIRDNYRFLINLQAAAPTGSKIKAEYLLPAYVGNGHHWELGVGLGGAWRMWCNEDAERSFNFIVEADITHLFNAKQQRTFDLKCKPLSRYMLAEHLITPTTAALALTPPTPVFDVFNAGTQAEYQPVANFSTRNAKVSIGVQGDLVAMFNYTCRGFSWDLGYNFWAMSASKISLDCDNDDCNDSCNPIITPFPTNWALKGDASVGGYAINAAQNTVTFGLGATEMGTSGTLSGATIFQGVGAGTTNANIDNRVNAQATVDAAVAPLFPFPGTATAGTNIGTSNPPVFISIDDLDVDGARQRGLSHKVFTHLSYTWRDVSDRWMPYVGAGVSAEFGSHTGNDDCSTTTATSCDTCPSSLSIALSRWAIEVKGGVSFH